MIRAALYINIGIILATNILFLVLIFAKKIRTKQMWIVSIMLLIWSVLISFAVLDNFVDVTFLNWLQLIAICVISIIMNIVVLVTLRNNPITEGSKYSSYLLVLFAVPVLLIAVPAVRESFLCGNADYVVKYGYGTSEGITTWNEDCFALSGGEVTPIETMGILRKWERNTDWNKYIFEYKNGEAFLSSWDTNDDEATAQDLLSIVQDAAERYLDSGNSVFIKSVPIGDYVLIEMESAYTEYQLVYYNGQFAGEVPTTYNNIETIYQHAQ